jgi:glyoxylase-like metal-dependent hydrolase (beta-lactamase superfamily II)
MEIKTFSHRFMFNNYVNCYLIKTGDNYFLIDTGFTRYRSVIEKEIERTGCGIGQLKLIILTHGDLDHAGNAAYLHTKFASKIAMHSSDIGMVEYGDMFFSRKNPNILVKTLANLFFSLKKKDRFIPDITVDGDYDFSEFGLEAKAIYIPCHTRGSIAILTAEGHFFCGDLMGNIKKPAVFDIMDDMAEAKAYIKKLQGLDIKIVYPGHGQPFTMNLLSE